MFYWNDNAAGKQKQQQQQKNQTKTHKKYSGLLMVIYMKEAEWKKS